MKRSEKAVLAVVLSAVMFIGGTIAVTAAGGYVPFTFTTNGIGEEVVEGFNSTGRIEYKESDESDPSIIIDNADLVTLAKATNELNTQFTDSLAAAVNNIGSVPQTDRVAAGAQFSDLLSAITNSQAIDTSESVYVLPNGTVTGDSTAEGVVETQIAGATAENLTAGTAAWVDGQYIVGTGADNNSYYTEGLSTMPVFKSKTVGCNSNGDGNAYVYLKDETEKYNELSLGANLFVCITESYHTYAQSTVGYSYTYNNDSGILTIHMGGSMASSRFIVYYIV